MPERSPAPTPQPPPTITGAPTRLRPVDLARLSGVSTQRVWEAAGLLSPRREPGTGYRHRCFRAGCLVLQGRGECPLPRSGQR
ncbi:hypothetical protein ACWD4G_22225 [Streptomyces sp. NPDC002643]